VKRRRPPRLAHETRLLVLALVGGLPAVLTALVYLYAEPHAVKVRATMTLVVVGTWIAAALLVRGGVAAPLQTMANLLAALREGDYSVRGRAARSDDALGGAMAEVNALGDRLRSLRVGALEATALLGKVLEEVDVAILAFSVPDRAGAPAAAATDADGGGQGDGGGQLALANRAAERLLGKPAAQARGERAADLGLSALLEGAVPRTVEGDLAGSRGQWELRRTRFRLDGKAHELVVVADLKRALRQEERQAWQRLVRVLGHEINNSLAPIQSIAGALRSQLARPERASDLDEDVARGLEIIERRAEALGRFLGAYARLTRLPPPKPAPVDVAGWVRRVAALEKRLPVRVAVAAEAAPLQLRADGDQLDQLLINLVKNGTEAALESGGAGVAIDWRVQAGRLELRVRDDGPGLAATANLFVPFFTTKPEGLGIGLVLSRQIAEAHGGALHLYNRQDARGCEALLTLPLP
jgi:two-component system nitrogen regulation sensor histidine kinase NtrY